MTLHPYTVICPRCSSPAPFTHGRYFCSGCWWCEWCAGTCNGTTATGCRGAEGKPSVPSGPLEDGEVEEPEPPRGLEELWKTEAKQFQEDIHRLAGQRPPLLVGDAGKPASQATTPETLGSRAVARARKRMANYTSEQRAELEQQARRIILSSNRSKAQEAAPALHHAMEAGGLVKRGDHSPWHCPSCGEWETTHRVEPTWWESSYKGWEKVMECPRCSHRYPL